MPNYEWSQRGCMQHTHTQCLCACVKVSANVWANVKDEVIQCAWKLVVKLVLLVMVVSYDWNGMFAWSLIISHARAVQPKIGVGGGRSCSTILQRNEMRNIREKWEPNATKWYMAWVFGCVSLVALQSQIKFANMVVLFRSIAHLYSEIAMRLVV